MNSDGTEPRRLARGGWPSWSQDSTQRLLSLARGQDALFDLRRRGRSEPKRIMACPSSYPSVSPDNQHVAYLDGAGR